MKEQMSKLRNTLQHSNALRWVDTFARRSGAVHLLHVIESRADKDAAASGEEFRWFCDQHQQELQKLSGMLEDDFSRLTLEKVLEYRKTKNIRALKGVVIQPQYFQKEIFGPVEDEVFIDGGAYVGDTVESFIKYCVCGGGTGEYMPGILMKRI